MGMVEAEGGQGNRDTRLGDRPRGARGPEGAAERGAERGRPGRRGTSPIGLRAEPLIAGAAAGLPLAASVTGDARRLLLCRCHFSR